MKYLKEIKEENRIDLLTEGEGQAKRHYFKGLFLEFDNFNRNKRIYRSDKIDPSVQAYIKEKINENRAWGELDHPDGPTINLKNVSHRAVELHKEGSNWHGKALITDTPCGSIVKGLMESGGNLGVSSRGMGTLKNIDEGFEVQPDYKILTVTDVVSDPSAHGALISGIMENVDYFYDEKTGSFLPEQSEELKKTLRTMSLSKISEKKALMFEQFMETLRNKH